jgi:hypothetical protein
MNDPLDPAYDIAVSFASEHRAYVESTVDAARLLDLRVFYGRDMTNKYWGGNFILEQRKVFGARARYFVPFLSTEYLSKPVPMDQFSAAMMTAVQRGDTYILPVLIGGVRVPPELLHPHTGYLKAEHYTPDELAWQLRIKVDEAKGVAQEPRDVRSVVQDVLRPPTVVPPSFKVYRELDAVFDYFGTKLEQTTSLAEFGFTCMTKRMAERIIFRIEGNGYLAYSLDVSIGDKGMGGTKLTFGPGSRISRTDGITAWAEPYYDLKAQKPKLNVQNFSLLSPNSGESYQITKEELFGLLWDRIVTTLEGS